MSVTLCALTAEDCEQVRLWRNQVRAGLRTPYLLTDSQQSTFFFERVSWRQSTDRYWGVVAPSERISGDTRLVGMAGLTGVSPENGIAEISLIIGPEYQARGYGKAAVDAVLEEGFQRMRLETIFGETYHCSPAVEFWRQLVERYHGSSVVLPRRKFWDGKLWDADYFTITRESWQP